MVTVLYCHRSGISLPPGSWAPGSTVPAEGAAPPSGSGTVGKSSKRVAIVGNIRRALTVLDRYNSQRLLSTQPVNFLDIPAAWPTGRYVLASLDPTRRDDMEALVSEITRLLDGMRHGSVTLIVQDGRVVQLDATHKVRLAGNAPPRRPATRG
jgi:hypothetical protein